MEKLINNPLVLELLFWLHITIIVGGLFMGFLLPLQLVVGIVFLHRMQFLIFNDCLLSKFQKRLRSLPEKKHFLQFAVKKIFNKQISDRQSHYLDYTLVTSMVLVSVVVTWVKS